MEAVGIISILLWVFVIVGWVIFNLYNKNRKLEKAVIAQDSFISSIYSLQSDLEKLIAKIDTTLWVQSDPEFIETISKAREIQQALFNYSSIKK